MLCTLSVHQSSEPSRICAADPAATTTSQKWRRSELKSTPLSSAFATVPASAVAASLAEPLNRGHLPSFSSVLSSSPPLLPSPLSLLSLPPVGPLHCTTAPIPPFPAFSSLSHSHSLPPPFAPLYHHPYSHPHPHSHSHSAMQRPITPPFGHAASLSHPLSLPLPLPLSLPSTISSSSSTPGAPPVTRPWHHPQQPQQQQPQSRALGEAHTTSLIDSLAASKLLMVENLVDTAAMIIESIWPNPVCNAQSKTPVIPLNIFVKETLRRSRTTLSTLQLALYYIHRVRARVLIAREKIHQDQIQIAQQQQQIPLFSQPGCPPSPCDSLDSCTSDPESVRNDYFNTVSGPLAPRINTLPLTPPDCDPTAALSLSPLSPSSIHASTSVAAKTEPIECGRRMFLAALILASKFLQDRTYSNKAWSKISGLPVPEINQNEIAFLNLIDYQLFVSPVTFQKWVLILTERGSRRARPSLVRSNSLPCAGGNSCSSDQVSAKRLKRYSSEIMKDAACDAQRYRLSTVRPHVEVVSTSDTSSRTQRGLGPYMTQCWVQEQQQEYLARSRLQAACGGYQQTPEYVAPAIVDLTRASCSSSVAGLTFYQSSTKAVDTLDAMLPSPAPSISPISLQSHAGMKRRLIEVEC